VRQALDALIFGGLLARPGESLQVAGLVVEGDKWSCEIVRSTGDTHRFSGVWNDQAARGFVESDVTIGSATDRGNAGFSTQFLNWSQEPASGMWLASRAELSFPDGTLRQVIRLDRVAVEAADTFELATRAPEWNGVDLIRGPVVATSVMDFRGDDQYRMERTPDGTVTRRLLEGDRPLARLRIAGWLALAALGALFVTLVVRRRLAAV
jgi:hypothetical protein